LTTVINGVRSVAVKFAATHPEAFGGCEHPFVAFAGGWGVGNSHGSLVVKKLNRDSSIRSMAERQILGDAINVRGIHHAELAKTTTALGIFALQQMPATSLGIEHFASAGDLETFGDRLLRFNAFWTTHK